MTSPSCVRIAGPADKVEIWRLFMANHEENGLFPMTPYKVNWHLDRALNPEYIHPADTGPRGIVGVIGPVGALEGIACLIIGNSWYSDEFHLQEMVVFVDSAHRKSRHAHALVNWMKLQSDITRRKLIVGVISTERTEAKVALFDRLLPRAGAFFLWTPTGSSSSGVPA
jgi:hypothetical protein